MPVAGKTSVGRPRIQRPPTSRLRPGPYPAEAAARSGGRIIAGIYAHKILEVYR